MVKSDALFSYIPPTNILGWLMTPLRYIIPFPRFVKLNRTIIKVTHLPILWVIFAYERLILSRLPYEPAELVEQRGRIASRLPAFSRGGPNELFSPGARLREPSITTFHKDKALEEVFRRPFKSPPLDERDRRGSAYERAESTNVVQDWMASVGQQGGASSPVEQSQSVVDRLESRRPTMRRLKTVQALTNVKTRDTFTRSDPEVAPLNVHASADALRRGYDFPNMSSEDPPQQTDADGDDELATNDEDDRPTYEKSLLEADENGSDKENMPQHRHDSDYFTPKAALHMKSPTAESSISQSRLAMDSLPHHPTQRKVPPFNREKMHSRNISSGTILYSPLKPKDDESHEKSPHSTSPAKLSARAPNRDSSNSASATPAAPGTTADTPSPRKAAKRKARAPSPAPPSRPTAIAPQLIFPAPQHRAAAAAPPPPNLAAFLALDRRAPSSTVRSLDLASDLGDNRYGPDAAALAAFPASFGTQMEMGGFAARARAARRGGRAAGDDEDGDGGATRRLNRLMLARMTNLEEGFREVLREVKRVSRAGSTGDEAPSKQRRERRGKDSMAVETQRQVESDREGRRRPDNDGENDSETVATRTSV